jgi:hypothetical protein
MTINIYGVEDGYLECMYACTISFRWVILVFYATAFFPLDRETCAWIELDGAMAPYASPPASARVLVRFFPLD